MENTITLSGLTGSMVVKKVMTKNGGVKEVVDFKGGYNKKGEWKSTGNWNLALVELCKQAGCDVIDRSAKK